MAELHGGSTLGGYPLVRKMGTNNKIPRLFGNLLINSSISDDGTKATMQEVTILGKLSIGTGSSQGTNSVAIGNNTIASGNYSHSEGSLTEALGNNSHAQNEGTISKGKNQTVIGKFNIAQGSEDSIVSTDSAFIIGNGINQSNRSNAMDVKWNGDVSFAGDITNGNGITMNNLSSKINELTRDYNIIKENKDSNGIFTTIRIVRSTGNLYQTSVLSYGTSPTYGVRTITTFDTDGTTVVSTKEYALNYDIDDELISETLIN